MLRSALIWFTTSILILLWLVLLAVSRLFDRDPVHYRTGFLFRKLGNALVKINPAWRLHMSGEAIANPRLPYVVVCNHQSMADIPLISNLPWEMKWLAKIEVFRLPILGWMLRLAGDICVDRKNPRSGALALIKAQHILEQKCSVMIFPEGTRSLDGRVQQFTDGAFHLAIKAKISILPIVIEGSYNCIQKHSWKFGNPSDIYLKVLPPVETSALTLQNVPFLRDTVRALMMKQIAEWRSVPIEAVDGKVTQSTT